MIKNKINTEDTILLVVDVQVNTLKTKERVQVTEDIVSFIDTHSFSDVYAVKWFSEEGSTFHLTRGTLFSIKEAGIVDERIIKHLSLPTFMKQAPSSFSNKDLAHILEEEIGNGKKILVVGFDVEDCVLSTVLDGNSRNLRMYAIKELCSNAGRLGIIDEKIIDSRNLILDRHECLISLEDLN